LGACRVRRATLIIAKLDRLARNVAFVSNLMESDVDFVACDNPLATRLTIHILAAVAEHEREMISARTIAALAVAKARGVKLGNPNLQRRRHASAGGDRDRGALQARGRARRRGQALYRRGAQGRLRLAR
jgi:DNA invertase Pin-like site-specific DNA recombinase